MQASGAAFEWRCAIVSVVLRACFVATGCAAKAVRLQHTELCVLLFRFASGALDLAGFAVHPI